MELTIGRDKEIVEANTIIVYIESNRYRISESADGRLCINKTSDDNSDAIQVHPNCTNQIEIS